MATPKRKPYDWLQQPQQPAPYTPGQSVQDAQKAYQGIAGQKPGDYVSQYQNRMTELYDKINNRQPFSYDVNADALYQQYKDQYQRMGKMAMQDTMGQAQAMTGGYGNTYAQTAGNQAYQGYLQRLNEMVPQLEQRSFDRYQAEGRDLYNQYGLAADADATDYGRYQDAYNRWAEDRGLAYDQYRDERGFDYGAYQDALQQSNWQQQFAYGQERDAVADSQWQQGFDYGKERDQADDSRWQAQFDYGKERDQTADSQWRETFDYGKYQDALQQENWNKQFEYGQQRDLVGDSRWQQQFEYGQQMDSQQQANWEKQFDYGVMSDQQKQDFNLAMAAIQAGKVPSAEQLKAAGIDPGTAGLLAQIYTPKPSGGGGARQKEEKAIATNFSATDIIAGSRALQRGGERGLQQYMEELILQGKATDEGAAVLYRHIHEYYAKNPSVRPDANVSRRPGNQQ